MTPEQASILRARAGWSDPIWGMDDYQDAIKKEVKRDDKA